ncbi:hypothetical protein HK097_009631 [Rhizophlyctis rosea]|uniref:Uncharacterized protein n=1 Tax=Rhizophlyctis rosea TaxID=64517 RepID=A0AAD5SAV5_9FUNG|nr:hypothetical protein HK097_009631 [Rhizophlyctis rosea]
MAVGIVALWGKLELAQVGVTLPEHLVLNPKDGGTWVTWNVWQVALLLGLANNVAALFAIGAPSKMTYLIEHHIDPKLFAGALVEEHGFWWAALLWFGTEKRDVVKAYEGILAELVPETFVRPGGGGPPLPLR